MKPRDILTLALLLGILLFAGYRMTHHPVFGNCHQTTEGQNCTLTHYEKD